MDTTNSNVTTPLEEKLKSINEAWAEKQSRQESTNHCECDCHIPPDEHGRAHGHSGTCCTACLYCRVNQVLKIEKHQCAERGDGPDKVVDMYFGLGYSKVQGRVMESRAKSNQFNTELRILLLACLSGDVIKMSQLVRYMSALYAREDLEKKINELLPVRYEP